MFRRPFIVPWRSTAFVGMQRNLFGTGQNKSNDHHLVPINCFAFLEESLRCCSTNNNNNNNENKNSGVTSPSTVQTSPPDLLELSERFTADTDNFELEHPFASLRDVVQNKISDLWNTIIKTKPTAVVISEQLNNDNNNIINDSNVATTSPSSTTQSPIITPTEKKIAEDQIIEAALNTPIADLIGETWNYIQQHNIQNLGSWLEQLSCRQKQDNRYLSLQTDNVIKTCFKHQLAAIEDITARLEKLRESKETEGKDMEKEKRSISSLEARLKEVNATSMDSLSPAALREHFKNMTVRQWLRLACSSDSTSFPYNSDVPSVIIVFDLVARFLHDNDSLQSILLERYQQILLQIHRDNERRNPSSGCEILAGSSHRHTQFPITGLLGRRSLLQRLRHDVEQFRKTVSKEMLALFTISSLPRQGKTALLDWMGYDRLLLVAFSGIHVEGCPVFVLNMTFNALWPAPNYAQPDCAYEFAITQMKIRLLAAALTKFTAGDFADFSDKMIVYMLAAASPNYASCWYDIVLPCLRSLQNIQAGSPVKAMLLFDEFTNIEPRLNSMPSQEFEKLRERIYSAATGAITSNTLVVVSGFTNAPKLATVSGRVIRNFLLDPIVSSVDARETLPMRSRYFQMIGRLSARMKFVSNEDMSLFDAPMAVYELAKSSPGVLGAILELGQGHAKTGRPFALAETVDEIPFLITLSDTPSLYDKMVKVLKYKSFQFLPNDQFENHPLLRTVQSTLVDAVFSSAAFTPGVRPDKPAPVTFLSVNLRAAHVEPLFLAYAFRGDFSEFRIFLEQLRCYSNAVMDSSLARNAVMTEFGRVPKSADNDSPQEQKAAHEARAEGIKQLTSSLFENAVLAGILFQRQLRQSLLREDVGAPSLECSLDSFVGRLAPIAKLNNRRQSIPTLCWNASSTSSLSSIYRFDCFRTPYPNLKEHARKCESQLCEEQLTFSLNSVHIPQRPENNPVADIIFHEQTSDGRLVQFWVDTKHSSINPLPTLNLSHSNEQFLSATPGNKVKLFRDSLANPLLQDPSCPVDHIVHIIVTSWSRERQTIETERGTELASDHSSIEVKAVLGRLSSYSLFIVRPDDAAFENLVSEPIKLAMPLLHEVDQETWAQKLPENPKDWAKFQAVKRDPAMISQMSIDEFDLLTDLAFAEDCAMSLVNSAVDAGFAGNIFADTPDGADVFNKLPFGSWLEALGARPANWNKKPFYEKVQFHKNEQSIELLVSEEKKSTRISLQANYVRHVTENFVTIGHLFHNRQDMAQEDPISQRIWQAFFVAGGEEDEKKNLRFACGVLWNTTLIEWNDDALVSEKNPSFRAEKNKTKSHFSADHAFAKKSARQIVNDLQESGKLRWKVARTENATQRSMTEVIQERVEKILKTIN